MICEKLFCPPKRSSLTETTGGKIYNRSVFVNTVLSTHIVNVTMQYLIISNENTWQLNKNLQPLFRQRLQQMITEFGYN